MMTIMLRKIVGCAILILAQVLVLNQIDLFGYATPYLYIYIILKMRIDVPRYVLLLVGFLLGLMIDLFLYTLGVHASATVLLAMCQPFFLRAFASRDDEEQIVPVGRKMGTLAFMEYMAVCVLMHHTALLMVEYFTFAGILQTLLRILCSSLLTFSLIMAVDKMTD